MSVSLLAVPTVGCGDGFASDDSPSDTDVDTDPSSADSATTGADETAAGAGTDDGPEGVTDADTTGADTASPGDSSGGSDDGLGCTLDCGGVGTCESQDDGPTCVCPDDYASTGLDCIPCTSISNGELPADVPAVAARFSITVAGAEAPASLYEAGDLYLRNTVTQDEVQLGRTHERNISVVVVPGVYDVFYSHREGGNEVPLNKAARLKTIEIVVDESFEIDIPAATLVGEFTINGGHPDNSLYNYGRVWLENAETGDRVLLGETRDNSYVANVVPGDYEIHYEAREAQGEAPANKDSQLESLTVLPAAEVLQTRDIDVPMVRYEGQVTIDDAVVEDLYEGGDLELRDPITGDRMYLADTRDGTYAIDLLPGTYELLYTSKEGGLIAPVNLDHVLQQFEVGSASASVDIDIPTIEVRGEFTVNQGPPPSSTTDDGVMLLRSKGGAGAVAYLGNTHDGGFSRRVIPGEYEVFYAQETAGGQMPANTNARLRRSVSLQRDTDTTIDLSVIQVSGAMTIAGAEAPDSPYDDGRLYLRSDDTGDSVLLGSTRLGTYSANIVPGTYDVVYEAEFSDTVVPVNRGAIVQRGIELLASGTLDIDIPVTSLQGDITVSGAIPPASEGVGQLFLRDVQADELVYLGHTGAPAFARPLMEGRYVVQYHGVDGGEGALGDTLPANSQAAFACYDIAAR